MLQRPWLGMRPNARLESHAPAILRGCCPRTAAGASRAICRPAARAMVVNGSWRSMCGMQPVAHSCGSHVTTMEHSMLPCGSKSVKISLLSYYVMPETHSAIKETKMQRTVCRPSASVSSARALPTCSSHTHLVAARNSSLRRCGSLLNLKLFHRRVVGLRAVSNEGVSQQHAIACTMLASWTGSSASRTYCRW
jgi:hypothetical protein